MKKEYAFRVDYSEIHASLLSCNLSSVTFLNFHFLICSMKNTVFIYYRILIKTVIEAMGKAYIRWIAVIIIRSNKVVSFNSYINIFVHSLIPQVFFSPVPTVCPC